MQSVLLLKLENLSQHVYYILGSNLGFPGGSDSKESACNARYLGRSPGEGNSYPLLFSCLENPMDRERSLVGCSRQGCKKLDMTEQLTLLLFSLSACSLMIFLMFGTATWDNTLLSFLRVMR